MRRILMIQRDADFKVDFLFKLMQSIENFGERKMKSTKKIGFIESDFNMRFFVCVIWYLACESQHTNLMQMNLTAKSTAKKKNLFSISEMLRKTFDGWNFWAIKWKTNRTNSSLTRLHIKWMRLNINACIFRPQLISLISIHVLATHNFFFCSFFAHLLNKFAYKIPILKYTMQIRCKWSPRKRVKYAQIRSKEEKGI